MGYKDLHTHSSFCDGADTPEAMVLSAIERGVETLGIVVHSYTEFDKECSVAPEREGEFIETVRTLKEKYRGKIELLLGIERDYCSETVSDGYDYTIGSVHYLKIGGEYCAIDASEAEFSKLCQRHFGGDYYALCEEYYKLVADIPNKFRPDIIGHIDLVTKFNEGNKYFDTENPRYKNAYTGALKALLPYGIPFEINTGAISRGYKSEPYPERAIRDMIRAGGGRLVLSSDAHNCRGIAFMFDEFSYCVTE